MSNEEVVERIVNNDSRAKKWFFMLFFTLFPLTGVLLFWFDGHARIEKEVVQYAEQVLIPELKSGGDLIEISTPEMGDKLRAGEYDWMAQDLGKLIKYERLDADQSQARELDDRGVIYAELDFSGEFEKGKARVHILVMRQSLRDESESTEEEKKTTNDEWMISKMEFQVKE